MAIFQSGPLRTIGWSLGIPTFEGNQWDEGDEGPFISALSSTKIEVISGGTTLIAEGKFTFTSNLIGMSVNEVVDLGLISGLVYNFYSGKYENGVFSSEAIITGVNKTIQTIATIMQFDKFMGILNGNDEIYGNNLIQGTVNSSYPKDDMGNQYSGNYLHGFDGNDKIYGGQYIDSLWGDNGNDSI